MMPRIVRQHPRSPALQHGFPTVWQQTFARAEAGSISGRLREISGLVITPLSGLGFSLFIGLDKATRDYIRSW